MGKHYNSLLLTGTSAVLIFLPIAGGSVKLWAITPVMLILYAMIFAWLFRMNNKNNGDSPLRGQSPLSLRGQSSLSLNIPIALFAVLAIVSFTFSIYKHDSFYALVRLIAYIGLYYLVVCEFGHKMVKHIIWTAIIIGGGLSIYGISQYLGVFDRSWWRPQEFLAATYTNHNHFAGYLELVMPVAATVLIAKSGEDRTLNKLILILALIAMFSAFILTQSRGAWICFGVSCIFAVFTMAKLGLGSVKKSVVSLLIIISVASVFYINRDMVLSRMADLDPTENIDGSTHARLKIWSGTLDMISERPLIGVGIGDFDYGFYRFKPAGLSVRAVYAHNDYLQAAAEMGIFAPILMVWIFAIIIAAGLKNGSNPYAAGCAIGVMSLALHGLVDFNFHIPANMVLFTVWLGIVMKESNVKRA